MDFNMYTVYKAQITLELDKAMGIVKNIFGTDVKSLHCIMDTYNNNDYIYIVKK